MTLILDLPHKIKYFCSLLAFAVTLGTLTLAPVPVKMQKKKIQLY